MAQVGPDSQMLQGCLAPFPRLNSCGLWLSEGTRDQALVVGVGFVYEAQCEDRVYTSAGLGLFHTVKLDEGLCSPECFEEDKDLDVGRFLE